MDTKPIIFRFEGGHTKLLSELSIEDMFSLLKDPTALTHEQHVGIIAEIQGSWKAEHKKTNKKGEKEEEEEAKRKQPIARDHEVIPLKCPILRSCGRSDFLNFRAAYEEYARSGGRLPPEQCMHRSAQLEWALIETDAKKRTSILDALVKEHAASSFPILKQRIRYLVPKGKMDVDKLRTYLGAVGDELSLLPEPLRGRRKEISAFCVMVCEDREFKSAMLDVVRFSSSFCLHDLMKRSKEYFGYRAIVDSVETERTRGFRKGQSKGNSFHGGTQHASAPRGRGRGRGRRHHHDRSERNVSEKEVRAVKIASKGEDFCLSGFVKDGSSKVPVKALVDTGSQVNIIHPRLGRGRGRGRRHHHDRSERNVSEKEVRAVTIASKGEDFCLSGFVKDGSSKVPVKALVDTGSQVNIIHPRLDGFDEEHEQVMNVAFTAIDEDNTYSLETNFFAVVSDVVNTHDMILGVDWARSTGVVNTTLIPKRDKDEEVDPFSKVDELGDIPVDVSDEELLEEVAKVHIGKGKRQLSQLLKEYKDILSPVLPPEGSKLRKFKIETTSDMIIHRKARFLSPPKMKLVKEKIDNWLEAGIITESTSPWAAPIVLAPRRDGDKRLCTDFTELNAITKPLPFPLPPVRHLLSSLKGYSLFSTFDLRSGFHQVLLEESAKEKTAFITPTGHYEYKRLPFGLKNAPAHFQQEMSRLLGDLVPSVCFIYIDDLIVPANSIKEMETKLRRLFTRLREIRLRLKAKKCLIGMETIEYLGTEISKDTLRLAPSRLQGLKAKKCLIGMETIEYLGTEISKDTLRLAPSRLQGLKDLAIPKNRRGVKSVIGLFSYYRAYIDHFESKIDPLRKLTTGKFEWKQLHQEAFDNIRQELLDRPPLHQIDYTKDIILRTDASDVGLGGILLQKTKEGVEETIMFISKAFRGAETRWQTNEQECFAIKYCLEKYKESESEALECAHVPIRLQFASCRRSGKRSCGLSRVGFVRRVAINLETLIEKVKKAQEQLTDEEKKDCYEEDGMFLTLRGDKLLIPKSESTLKRWILSEHHNSVVGHGGRTATVDKILQTGVTWSGLYTDVRKLVAGCPVCIKLKAKPPKPSTTLSIHKSLPFRTIAVDTLGPFPVDVNGYAYIIVMIDCFTRLCELVPVKTTNSHEAALAIFNGWFARYGLPHTVVSDQGSQFCNYLSDHIYDTFGVKHHRIVTGHHSANGIVERLNKEITKHIQALIIEIGHREKWTELLPLVQNICINTSHSSTGTTAQKLVFGDFACKSVMKDWNKSRIESETEMPKEREEEMDYVESLTSNIDRGINIPQFLEGSYVLVRSTAKTDKLTPEFSGPYKVLSKISEKEYRVVNIASAGDDRTAHVDDMVDFEMDSSKDPQVEWVPRGTGQMVRYTRGQEHLAGCKALKEPKVAEGVYV
ncbi:hypothetical protein ADUPG1_013239 [Aduncisulcus paluster]|uniref:Endonuclease n=1 Tax=Aduncisulcus paluster TaxID=2918883 RepID=A0ABQ5K275_9EUKA|nr:hypothetical protein ADUPG1_013239 [Aduncisulcus paluster]